MGFLRGNRIEIKSPDQFASMRQAGIVVGRTLELVRQQAEAGMTTADIDAIAREQLKAAGAQVQ